MICRPHRVLSLMPDWIVFQAADVLFYEAGRDVR